MSLVGAGRRSSAGIPYGPFRFGTALVRQRSWVTAQAWHGSIAVRRGSGRQGL